MPNLDLLPAGDPDDPLALETRTLALDRMIEPAREAGYALHLVGATVLPQHQTIVHTAAGRWLLTDHREDPTADQYGGKIPIPEDQLARLRDLDAHGVAPDLVWPAHELPPDWQEGAPLPHLVPPPPALRETDERLASGLGAATKAFALAAGVTAGGAAAVPALALGAIVSSVGLDPIILGGVCHPKAPIVQWAILAQWAWE